MSAIALLAAAGLGTRLGSRGPKALQLLGGRTLLEHALAGIEAAPVDAVVVAVPPGDEDARALAEGFPKVVNVVDGGASRRASIRIALDAAPPRHDVVLCHDAARPLATPALFHAVLAALDRADAAVPVVPVTDTVKRLAGDVVAETLSRDELGLAQTPQAFRRDVLVAAHRDVGDELEVTDDAMLVELAGGKVTIVPGEPGNIKITTLQDFALAEVLLGG